MKMPYLVADTRASSSGHSLEDRHLEEWVRALSSLLPDVGLQLLKPDMDGLRDVGSIAKFEPWQLSGGELLRYVQRTVPQAGERIDAQAIFCLFGGAPLVSKVPVVSVASGQVVTRDASILGRLAYATGKAGVNAATLQVEWADFPTVNSQGSGHLRLDPWVHPAFSPEPTPEDQIYLDGLKLDRGFLLVIGLIKDDLEPLMSAWRWVVDVHGQDAPLVLTGIDPNMSGYVRSFVESSDTPMDIRVLDMPTLEHLPGLYRQAGLLLHGRGALSGQGLRWGLACGIPTVAFESEFSASLVGDAAYLVKAGDHRALTGAVLSLLIQEDFAGDLRKRALTRAAAYLRKDPLLPLSQALQRLIHT